MQKPTVITIAIALMAAAPVAAQEMGGATGPGPQPDDHHSYYQEYRRDGFWPGRAAGDVHRAPEHFLANLRGSRP